MRYVTLALLVACSHGRNGLTGTQSSGGSSAGSSAGASSAGSGNSAGSSSGTAGPTANPILFVAQVPTADDFSTIGSVFANHLTGMQSVARGGDLYIRYPNGTLKNLTKLAGFGMDGVQGANAIAVRDPSVSWDGTKAIFSMVIGAPTARYQITTDYWQMYEVSGLGASDTPTITAVANQPTDNNNISPLYGTDGNILFTSDRSRAGSRTDYPQLYPQLDEYEEAPTPTGVWSLNPATGAVHILNHVPSGAFSPTIDSYGRVIMTRWDHLQRDQQADTDASSGGSGFLTASGGSYATFNYAGEGPSSGLASRAEVYPEPRSPRTDLLAANLEGNDFNQFFPWAMNEDGTNEETINHIGRHELFSYFNKTFKDDPDESEFVSASTGRTNPNPIENFLQIREDPTRPGTYFGVDAPEFYTHAAGQIIAMTAPPGLPADQIVVNYITDRATASFVQSGQSTPAGASGHYRQPLPMSDGTLVASHTAAVGEGENSGTRTAPVSTYMFRLKTLKKVGDVWVADAPLTSGITKDVTWWDPDEQVHYSGELWEIDPVEVVARTKPATLHQAPVPAPELASFSAAGVDVTAFQTWLTQQNLALFVSRNVTTRDKADKQQPYNLHVTGSSTQTLGVGNAIPYDIEYLQLFQADQIRGVGGMQQPRDGRRVLAQYMHEAAALTANGSNGGPTASVTVAADGSVAAFVPARRAMTWQLTSPHLATTPPPPAEPFTPVVRERYWLTFQPGEVRVCASCHGLNSEDQAGHPVPTNTPAALTALLTSWKTAHP